MMEDQAANLNALLRPIGFKSSSSTGIILFEVTDATSLLTEAFFSDS